MLLSAAPKFMKFIVTLSLSFYSSIFVYGQNIHCLLFCKTNDKDIGTSVRINIANMEELVESISVGLGLKLQITRLTGNNFKVVEMNKVLDKLRVARRDIVIVYISSHGAKSPLDRNIFPQIDVPDEYVATYKIHKKIAKLHPKNLITIVEACSGFADITPQNLELIMQSGKKQVRLGSSEKIHATNIRHLFASQCSYIISAGQPGLNTWATDRGSIFTNSLVRAFDDLINMPENSPSLTFDNLWESTRQKTFAQTQQTSLVYFPVWEISNCLSTRKTDSTRPILVTPPPKNIINNEKPKTSNLKFDLDIAKRLSKKTSWGPSSKSFIVEFRISGGKPIKRVIYFLTKDFKSPVIELTNTTEHFKYRLLIYREFTVKAQVFYEDGKSEEIYKRIKFSSD